MRTGVRSRGMEVGEDFSFTSFSFQSCLAFQYPYIFITYFVVYGLSWLPEILPFSHRYNHLQESATKFMTRRNGRG